MRNKSIKREPTVDQLTSQEQRNASEAQAVAVADAMRTALVPVLDARVESIKKSNGDSRIAVRAASGRFSKMTTAVAHADAKAGQQFLMEKVVNEAGKELTRKQHLREALYSGALDRAKSDKGYGGAVKGFQALNEDAALTQQKEAMVSAANQEESHPVRVIMVGYPDLMHKEMVNFEAEMKKREEKNRLGPSFAASEVLYTNPAQE